MAKVLFTISYEIQPEKREEYLSLAQQMKQHFTGAKGKDYTIFEQKSRKNSFSELFICRSVEEFDQLEDDQDDTTQKFINQLDEYLVNGKMKYSTLIEI